jgi:hypothetical protein
MPASALDRPSTSAQIQAAHGAKAQVNPPRAAQKIVIMAEVG